MKFYVVALLIAFVHIIPYIVQNFYSKKEVYEILSEENMNKGVSIKFSNQYALLSVDFQWLILSFLSCFFTFFHFYFFFYILSTFYFVTYDLHNNFLEHNCFGIRLCFIGFLKTIC